jgi:hypothetical protein
LQDHASFHFNNLNDTTKTANIAKVLIRNVAAPTELYKKPPKVSPKIPHEIFLVVLVSILAPAACVGKAVGPMMINYEIFGGIS